MTDYCQYDDRDLLHLLAYDDEQAFVAIYKRYWPLLHDAASRRLKDSAMSEDVVQEVFTRLWSRRRELRIGRLDAYLLTAVRYRVLNHVVRGTAPDPVYQPLEDIFVSALSADGGLLEKELQQLAQYFIASLPAKRRRIFQLRFIEDLSTREIAARLHISRKTVQNQLRTAVEDLKAQLTVCLLLFLLLLN